MNKQELKQDLREKMLFIYGESQGLPAYEAMLSLVERWESVDFGQSGELSERNAFLITYGDAIRMPGKTPLAALHTFLKEQVGRDAITDIHLLPMFPYTSDDGFSVTDYRAIHPDLGSWEDIGGFLDDYRLMFDFVANHVSKSSEWFQGYLRGNQRYEHYFIPREEEFDVSQVIRPRTSPLFHEYEGSCGQRTAWTTFSEDQVDLNASHFPVLCELSDILLDYARHGASAIRLDAIGFLWKDSGTTCMHLPRTHAIISTWRRLLDYFKPGTQIITETNVPHADNISYFGDGMNEANMVYQFSLPPLVLFTLTVEDATKLTQWAKGIKRVSDTATYFNFLASHDGIGMRPAEGILNEQERQLLAEKTVANGGRISYKNNPDGTKSVYELNINYIDALANAEEKNNIHLVTQKALAAHCILCSVIGVPAIYYHSLFGSSNDYKGLEESGINRRINREKLDAGRLTAELTGDERRRTIFSGITAMLAARRKASAFSPYASQEILELDSRVFAVRRNNAKTGCTVTAIINVTGRPVQIKAPKSGRDLLTNKETGDMLELGPYGYMWIQEN
ncbi:alpha-amylase [Paenibacillus sp. 79R4]|uniref:alpha-amylase family glycosyl hydrolase n=1 Tax=Paenibacillus sp. 79R4 TaxID=2212847 RepID=UPI0015BC7156|nr:alpha-amylase family glycosyl hydrolase [Paenibacillus sp. 79R4]NWL88540.1 alpha-amylase [Paenibacillus sp. 79R4]